MELYYGEEDFLIENALKNWFRQKATQISVFGPEDTWEMIELDLSTSGLFFAHKQVVIKNHAALASLRESNILLSHLQNLPANIDVALVWEEKGLPNNALMTWMLSRANVHNFNRLDSKAVVNVVKNLVLERGGQIANHVAIKLAAKLPMDLRTIVTEIDKLLLEQNEITETQINQSIGEYLKDDAFALTNALTSHDVYGIALAYKERSASGAEPTQVLSQIGSLLGLGLQVAALYQQGVTTATIATTMRVHPFRVQRVLALITNNGLVNVKNLIIALATTDAQIKRGTLPPAIALDQFILQTMR